MFSIHKDSPSIGFIGDWSAFAKGPDGDAINVEDWKGDKLYVTNQHAKVKVRFTDEREKEKQQQASSSEPRRQSKGFFKSLFTSS